MWVERAIRVLSYLVGSVEQKFREEHALVGQVISRAGQFGVMNSLEGLSLEIYV